MGNFFTKKIVDKILILMVVSGCAQNVWVKPGANQEAFRADNYGCERDSRQSGGFGTGLVGAIEAQAFFNRCMTARGWSLQERTAAEATINVGRTSVQTAVEARRSCFLNVRQQPRYQIFQNRLSEISTGRFTFAQMASNDVPSPTEAALILDFVGEGGQCNDRYFASIENFVTPQQLTNLKNNRAANEALLAQLARRQISWGELSTRSNQILDNSERRAN